MQEKMDKEMIKENGTSLSRFAFSERYVHFKVLFEALEEQTEPSQALNRNLNA